MDAILIDLAFGKATPEIVTPDELRELIAEVTDFRAHLVRSLKAKTAWKKKGMPSGRSRNAKDV